MILGFPRAKQGLCHTKHGGAGGIILWALLSISSLFYGGPVGIEIQALLSKSQCSVFDTQVTVKALGLFFISVAVRVLDNFEFILYIGKWVVFEFIKNSVIIDFCFLFCFLVWIEDLHC